MSVSLNDLEMLLNDLWRLDENKCIPEKDYSLNLQGRLRGTRSGRDLAQSTLFDQFDESIFNRSTYSLFRKLLDNYNMATGVRETVTQEERKEESDFLDEVIATPVMSELHRFLVARSLVSAKKNEFKRQLHYIWFEMYRRTVNADSCGFEHVFVGEIRDGQIIGLHNWIQIYLLEKAGNINYKGYFDRGTSDEGESPRVITMQFTWKTGETKPLGSSFIGTSPEFEMAFFTAMHYSDLPRGSKVKVSGYRMELVHHKIAKDRIGTSYIVGLD